MIGIDKYFKAYSSDNKMRLALIVIFLCAAVLLSIPIPFISKIIIDDILLRGDTSAFPKVCAAFALIMIAQLGIGRLNAWLVSDFVQKFVNGLRWKIADVFLKADTTGQISAGNLMVVINSDASSLGQQNINMISTFCKSIFSIAGYSTMLFALNYKLALLSLALFPAYFLWVRHISGKMQVLSRRAQEINEVLLGSVEQIEKNIETIRIYQYSENRSENFRKITQDIGIFSKKVAMYSNFVSSVSGVITTIATFVPLLVGVNYVVTNAMTVGDLIAFNAYCGMLFAPLASLIELKTKQKLIEMHEERIDQVFSQCKKNESKHTRSAGADFDFGIELENYTLMAHKRPLVSTTYLQLEPGISALVEGGNGCGKSLLLKSIAGIYHDYTGSIFLDDTNIKQMEKEVLRKSIVYVSPQQEFILDELHTELYSYANMPNKQVDELLHSFGLTSAIADLPNGIHSSCESLAELNTGSLQKLRIARAVVRLPRFLLLDEMFSNISSDQVDLILDVLARHFPEMAIVIVEHHVVLNARIERRFVISNHRIKRTGL